MIEKRNLFATILKWVFLAVVFIFIAYPIIYAILGSFKTNYELTLGGGILPRKWMFENYVTAFIEGEFYKYTINSIVVAVLATGFSVITAAMAAYVLARHEVPGKKLIIALYIALMFVSLGAVTIRPIYMLFNGIGLSKSLLGIALVLTGGQSSSVLLIIGFFKSLPKEIDESAHMDGCGSFRLFYQILLPLIKPILGVVALFAFRGAWNDYLNTYIMSIGSPNLKTLTVAVVQLQYDAGAAASWHLMLAGASIALIPILTVYLFANKQFISGLTAGSVKG
jgi:raffinose/stachyose/melibiose transport system permease protein